MPRSPGRWSTRRSLAVPAVLLLAVACGGGGAGVVAAAGEPVGEPAGQPPGEVTGEVTVFAAASLTDAFADVAAAFSGENPGATVTYSLAGSQALASQIVEGAPADVVASANRRQMDVVGDAGLLAGEPEVFAGNVLEIAVEPGNPLGVATLADLARPDVTLVLAAPEVPAGQYAAEALATAGVTATPASLEADVRTVLSRVSLGEADAGIVYASDVAAAAGAVDGVAIPPEQNVPASYPVAVLGDAPNAAGARAFVDFVLSADGQAILAEHGFTAP